MKSYEERMRILARESKHTMDDALDKLSQNGKAIVIRPTGFGKTYMLVHLAEEYILRHNKKVLYLYPNDIIVNELLRNEGYNQDIIKEFFVFKSYQEVSLVMGGTLRETEARQQALYNEIKDTYSVVLLDEVHRCASSGFNLFYEMIKDLISPSSIHMIGVTATPNRMQEEESIKLISYIFENSKVYKYDLGDAFRDGLLPQMLYGCREYDLDSLVDELRVTTRNNYQRAGKSFDEECFNMEISKLYQENGTESDFIYSYIKSAGYNLASNDADDSYLKFIVFFSNAQDMIERGEKIEQWFINACNVSAKNDLGFKSDFTYHIDYVVSTTTDMNADYEVKAITSKSPFRSYITNASKIGENDCKKARHIDLIFNINIINMGYHVDNISGIMMLRATKSEIIYYQQLGRCLSVKATKQPIVLDIVQNISVNFNVDKRQQALQDILLRDSEVFEEGHTLEQDGGYYDSTSDTTCGIELFATGHRNRWQELKDKLSDVCYTERSQVVWMYVNRHTPICVIAQNLNLSCSKVAEYILREGFELSTEDAMYKFYETEAIKDSSSNEFKVMKYLYSKKALDCYSKVKNTSQSLFMNILKLLNKGGNSNG